MNLLLETRVMLGEDREYLLEEGYKEAIKDFGEDSKLTIEKFKELVKRNQFQGQEKNIDFWRKQGFDKFKTKVDEVENKGSKNKQKKIKNSTPHKDAIKVQDTENYEVFQIKNYEASKFMGRFYKNKSTAWCISTDEKKYFNDVYEKSSFYFFIRKEFQGDDNDKIALQILDGKKFYWDVAGKDGKTSESEVIPDDVKKYVTTDFDRIEVPFIDKVISKGRTTDGTYEIVDGVYNVEGNINMNNMDLEEIPIKFGIVNGSFLCAKNMLTSLKNAPTKVKWTFDCHENELTDLVGGPVEADEYDCQRNSLNSLKGAPKKVMNFRCYYNPLDSSKVDDYKETAEIGGKVYS